MFLGQTRTLVTGNEDFLGTHLCRRLLDHGHDVFCIDNLSTGTRRNIEDLLGNRRTARAAGHGSGSLNRMTF
ncbi:MAG: NAD-dependent epimerase/dehydratase family protein [Methylocella sp.]|nr:MAG: hypothetical protein DLM68_14675 [Hyphomicrobiales bacterium]